MSTTDRDRQVQDPDRDAWESRPWWFWLGFVALIVAATVLSFMGWAGYVMLVAGCGMVIQLLLTSQSRPLMRGVSPRAAYTYLLLTGSALALWGAAEIVRKW
jgi:hypothetical protein